MTVSTLEVENQVAKKPLPVSASSAVVVSKNFNKGALGATTPTFWVLARSSHANVLEVKI